jgi:hypothetical protein
MAQDFLFGLSQFLFLRDGDAGDPVTLGYIEEDSFDLGGQAGETTEVNAAQVKGSPVLVLPKKNGSIKPAFDLIEIQYPALAKVMGGTCSGGQGTETGWNAPADLVQVKGHAQIITDSGHLIDIPAAQVTAYPTDKLSLSNVAKIHVELTPVQSAPNAAPYSISDYVEPEA